MGFGEILSLFLALDIIRSMWYADFQINFFELLVEYIVVKFGEEALKEGQTSLSHQHLGST